MLRTIMIVPPFSNASYDPLIIFTKTISCRTHNSVTGIIFMKKYIRSRKCVLYNYGLFLFLSYGPLIVLYAYFV